MFIYTERDVQKFSTRFVTLENTNIVHNLKFERAGNNDIVYVYLNSSRNL